MLSNLQFSARIILRQFQFSVKVNPEAALSFILSVCTDSFNFQLKYMIRQFKFRVNAYAQFQSVQVSFQLVSFD